MIKPAVIPDNHLNFWWNDFKSQKVIFKLEILGFFGPESVANDFILQVIYHLLFMF